MRSIFKLIFLLLPGLLLSCEECTDCLEYDNEPYVKMRFFQKSDLSVADVAILEVNGLDGSDIIWYQDTTNEFILPLSMNANESFITLTYAYPTDSSFHYDSMEIGYERKLERTIENYMQVNNYFTEILYHSFDSLTLKCKDSEGNCKSNEAVINIYF